MTKVINLYQSELAVARHIEFVEAICDGVMWDPEHYNFIELISRNYRDGMDLMFAYDDPKTRDGVLYLGYFRDGVIETV